MDIFGTQEIREYRGVKGLVAAKVLTDNDTDGYSTDTPFLVAAVAEISKSRDTSSEAHYYNNIPAVVISSDAPDTVTIDASKIPLEAYAKITSQMYDATTGTLIEGERGNDDFAIGYITEDTKGALHYIWRLKGKFNTPGQTNSTKNNGTDANGQEIVYTGVNTTAAFAKTGKGAMAVNVEAEKDLVDLTHFFDTVQTPDTITPKTPYTVTITQGTGTTGFVVKDGSMIASGATVHAGDVISVNSNGSVATVTQTGSGASTSFNGVRDFTVANNVQVSFAPAE